MSTEHSFREGFYNEIEGPEGTAFEIVPVPQDAAHALVVPGWRPWPYPIITYLSTHKVGNRPGCNTAVVEFIFDRPVTAWVVRVNSWSHEDGRETGQWASRDPGFGYQPFGAAPFGGMSVVTRDGGRVEITDAELLQGENQVAIYGRGTNGMWTPPVRVPS